MTPTTNQTNEQRQTVREWLKRPYVWRIPVYQRHYAWDPEENHGPTQLFWEVVQEQAQERLDGKNPPAHYFGAIVVDNQSESLKPIQQYDVVDGQQRLITLNLAMFALIGVAKEHKLIDQMRDQLVTYICIDKSHSAEPETKLQPTNFDREQYEQLLLSAFKLTFSRIEGTNEQREKSKVVMAFGFLHKQFTEFVHQQINKNGTHAVQPAMEALRNSILDGFDLVLIPLRDSDEAQKIFESMNNTARPLTTFDLIRNNVFYRAAEKPGRDIKLFRSSLWQQFETTYWEGYPGRKDPKKPNHVESYVSRMLTAKLEKLIPFSTHEVFKAYKEFANEMKADGADVQTEIATMSEYVDTYKHLMSGGRNPTPNVDYGIFYHSFYKSMDFYPLLFIISTCNADPKEKQWMISLLESYVVRRDICKLTSSGYNKDIPRICKAITDNVNYATMDKYIKERRGDSIIFPDDQQVDYACINEHFFKSSFKQYVFSRIAYHVTSATMNEKRDLEGLNTDHIIPQGWRENSGWQETLSKESYDEYMIDSKIHTIGNLTPMAVGLNSGKRNHAWGLLEKDKNDKNKKSARDWLRRSDLAMTRTIGENNETWGVENVIARSKELAKIICEIWPYDINLS